MIAALPMILGNRRIAGIPLKEARLLAGAHSHLNRLMIPKGNVNIFRKFISRILSEGVDLIYLEDVPDDFPDRPAVTEFCRSEKLLLEVRTVRQSPYIPTGGSFEEYREKLSKKFRELLNNRLNRMNRAGGFEIKTYESSDTFDILMQEMRMIAGQSWQGENKSGMFSDRSNEQFYNNLIRDALENGYGRVFILYFDKKPSAFEFHVYSGKIEYCLKSEYSREIEKLSPGGVLDLELVKRAFASDMETYDLLGFEDPYKLRWTRCKTPYLRYFIFSRSMAARTAYVLYYRLGNRLRKSKFLRRLKDRHQGG
jgi:CelD/BcsL family acetyltransferase involved in cellulose biosynthesis